MSNQKDERVKLVSIPVSNVKMLNGRLVAKGYNEKLRIGYCEDQGKRGSQEDALAFSELDGEQLKNLTPEEIGNRLWTTHRMLDDEEVVTSNVRAGTTASTTVYDGKGNFVTATLGDAMSFAVVFDLNNQVLDVVRLNSLIHHPSEPSEVDRIKMAGGVVIDGRISGELAVSRAIGDHAFKKIKNNPTLLVSSESTIDIVTIDTIVQTLRIEKQQIGNIKIITACDGFTEQSSLKTEKAAHEQYLRSALKRIRDLPTKNEQQIAQDLVDYAIEDQSRDNVSVAVHTVQVSGELSNTPILMGVYDGHGNASVSTYVAQNIGTRFEQQCQLTNEKYAEQALTLEKQQQL